MIPVPLASPGRLRSISLSIASPMLLVPVGTSVGTHTVRRVAYVHVRTDVGEGVGEVAAMESAVGGDARLAAVLRSLESIWMPRVIHAAQARGGVCPGSHLIAGLGSSTASDRMAVASIEMALLDLELRAADRSLADWLGIDATEVPFGAVVGIPADRDTMVALDRSRRAVDAGAARIRLKIEPGFSTVPARTILEATGVPVQVDANGGFELDAHGRLEPELVELDLVGVSCIEQPIAGHDLTSMAAAREQLRTPMCLDEPVSGVRQARDIVRYRAADALCVKPGRMGGLRPALRVLEISRDAGLRCFIGGMFETGLGRASLGVLSQHPAATLISDVAAPTTYLTVDPCDLAVPVGGRQPLWCDPGVGPHPAQRNVEIIARAEL